MFVTHRVRQSDAAHRVGEGRHHPVRHRGHAAHAALHVQRGGNPRSHIQIHLLQSLQVRCLYPVTHLNTINLLLSNQLILLELSSHRSA